MIDTLFPVLVRSLFPVGKANFVVGVYDLLKRGGPDLFAGKFSLPDAILGLGAVYVSFGLHGLIGSPR